MDSEARLDAPKKRRIMSTLDFSEASGFPIRLIRDYCREGLITCWQHGGKKFLIDYDAAMHDLDNLTVRRHRIPAKKLEHKGAIDKQTAFLEQMKAFK